MQIRDSVDSFAYIWVFEVDNMRNTFLKQVREHWKEQGRFYFGKNRVMAKALGLGAEDEYQENLHHLATLVTGTVGLFFTNASPGDVKEFFDSFQEQDYARGGALATETFILPAGPVMRGVDDPFPNSIESQLRALGVPTLLKNGNIIIMKN